MAQLVKLLATKPEDLSSDPDLHSRGRELTPTHCLLTDTCLCHGIHPINKQTIVTHSLPVFAVVGAHFLCLTTVILSSSRTLVEAVLAPNIHSVSL